ncbi:alpha/beta fold hydrolase [Hydrogenophaga laconesensis]|uniref:Pimeloyl-ACP methyl ester carboxylesterase n=1 Tax=Hydrogenophaga laconesensis TaxID=1805971 RepID=A0ABU1VIY4_9BURK|nr:alpha/beta hydrolase [Hydrogenophaga laconesensis]MDR7097454.1 pimeloyl-ACP methyl ester carboxylesterase [Hydrogenophaga laconesensis]
MTGRYLRTEVKGREQRIYVEEAGEGIPLICLHTAGSDSRQYRGLMNDPAVTSRYRVIAFDLPWHGKSAPPEGFMDEAYRLDSDTYVETILAVARDMALDRPVVMGCSIGGRVVLHLLLRHAERFRAAIGLQTSISVTGRLSKWQTQLQYLNRPDVHGGEAAAGLVSGLMGPQSPTASRLETLWYYAQSGPGVFFGDIFFYKDSGNLTPDTLAGIDTGCTPLHLLSGEYDYSAPPQGAEEVHRLVPGSTFKVMTGLGHFPMSENYPHFRTYLLPILDELAAQPAVASAV